jgi:hypothetical protein
MRKGGKQESFRKERPGVVVHFCNPCTLEIEGKAS